MKTPALHEVGMVGLGKGAVVPVFLIKRIYEMVPFVAETRWFCKIFENSKFSKHSVRLAGGAELLALLLHLTGELGDRAGGQVMSGNCNILKISGNFTMDLFSNFEKLFGFC